MTCFNLPIPNAARLTGTVTNSSDGSLMAVGTSLFWEAQDNGEGANAPPDRVSNFYTVAVPNFCSFSNVLDKDWTNGNVQIK